MWVTSSRFANHLCPPLTDLVIIPIRCDAAENGELPFARAALFASRDIEAGEELGFDYADAGGGNEELADGGREELESRARTRCLCGSPGCRGWMPFDREL